MKNYDCGLIVGRFQSLHLGHVKLIETSTQLCDRTLILIGSAQEAGTRLNPFDVLTRTKMIRQVFPNEEEVLVHSISDFEDPDKDWGDYVLEHCKRYFFKEPDIFIYGSDRTKSDPWFTEEQMYRTSQMIVSREGIKTSGTKMRECLMGDLRIEWMNGTHPKLHKMYDELRQGIAYTDG